jgi:hypothetical protein
MCGRFSNTGKQTDEVQTKLADLLGVSRPESDRPLSRR